MILSLETSTFFCSAAIHNKGSLLVSSAIQIRQSTASQLSVMVDQMMKMASLTPKQLEAVAISAGPGSYTGLRIGVATAKGMCYGLKVPLIAINSLDLLVAQVQPYNYSNAWLCPMFDARRMEVYTRLYKEDGSSLEPIQSLVVDELSFHEQLRDKEILFFGNGADKCQDIIRHTNAKFITRVSPSAEKLGEMAFQKFNQNNFEELATYEPFYLKEFIAKKPKSVV
jgi:tRNA threonylcarbamoyladenosine biosynthesis protein TsaB